MILKVIIDDQLYELNVPEAFIQGAAEFFDEMDRDMDKGWQMSREWVDEPDRLDRCRIVADKLLTALEKENNKLGRLMAGYILSRLPEIESLELDTSGEIQNTRITLGQADTPAPVRPAPAPAEDKAAAGMDKMAALEQAGTDVTQVFKVGRNWRFSVFDHASGEWRDSPSVSDKDEAEHLRQLAFRERYQSLMDG